MGSYCSSAFRFPPQTSGIVDLVFHCIEDYEALNNIASSYSRARSTGKRAVGMPPCKCLIHLMA